MDLACMDVVGVPDITLLKETLEELANASPPEAVNKSLKEALEIIRLYGNSISRQGTMLLRKQIVAIVAALKEAC
jgi:hypothetical protein